MKILSVLLISLVLLAFNVVHADQPEQAQKKIPVTLGDQEVFIVTQSPLASITPEARAAVIQGNLKLFAEGNEDEDQLHTSTRPEGIAIGTDKQVLIVITPADALLAGKDLTELSITVAKNIKSAISLYRAQHQFKTYAIGVAMTLAAIIVLWTALYWNKRAFNYFLRKAAVVHVTWRDGWRVKDVRIVSSTQIEAAIVMLLKSFKIFVALLLLYFFLPLILSFFPETRKLSATIFSYILTPFSTLFLGIVRIIPNLFYIFVIGVIAHYALKVIAYVFRLIEQGDLVLDWFYDDWAKPTYQIVRFLVIVTALIAAFPYIPGSNSVAFQGVGLVLGAIVSFSSSSAISNIVAGVILTYTRAFRLNDRIQVGETVGDVIEKTLLVTRVRTIKHVMVTIPNSLVMGAQIINYSTSAAEGSGLILHTSVTIGYDTPQTQIEALLIAAALHTEGLLKTPEPFVLQTSLDDWYVTYEINAYTKEPHRMAAIYSALHANIQKQFDQAGVEIMSPHYLTLRDGNASTVPSVLNTPNYKAQPFQVTTVVKNP